MSSQSQNSNKQAGGTAPVELRAGALRLVLRPDIGGSVAGLWHGDLPVLRGVADPAALAGPRQSGCFPLVPYSNRLGYKRFRWLGREHTTLANFGDDYPHSLHGSAWQQPWRVVDRDERHAELMVTQRSDAHWPYAFDVLQRFELTEDSLTMRLVFTNIDARAQPVGLGWHPYFPKRERSRLRVECAGRWESDAGTHLPTRRVATQGIDGEVRHLDFDHCFEGWRGAARLRDEALSISVTSSLPYLVVYTPPQQNYFCVEPVSHVSNAIHMADPIAHGLVAVGAGETLDAWMKIEVVRT
jgi:aldose 1-epimerase